MGWLVPADPGVVGYVVGGLLLAAGLLLLWRWWSRRRFHAEVAAEYGPAVGRVRVPQGCWHPPLGPRARWEVQQAQARCEGRPDVTARVPRQRPGSRG